MERLRQLREDCGMSQQTLADLLHVTQQAVVKYEYGTSDPNLTTLKRMATIFHVSIDYLLDFDPDEFYELSEVLSREDIDWEIEVTRFDKNKKVKGDSLRLLASYNSTNPPIRPHILAIVEELSKMGYLGKSDKDTDDTDKKSTKETKPQPKIDRRKTRSGRKPDNWRGPTIERPLSDDMTPSVPEAVASDNNKK